MRVVVPYTNLRNETRAAIEASGWDYDPIDVSSDDEAYWRLLRDLWAAGETFCIVEQDIVVKPETLDGLAACTEWRCAAAYPYFNGLYPGLGCTRFSAELLSSVPGAIEEIGSWSDEIHPLRHWCRLDGWLQTLLKRNYHVPLCTNHGIVGHIRDYSGSPYPSHGCVGGFSSG